MRRLTLGLLFGLSACVASSPDLPGGDPSAPGGKEDSGWLGSNSFELGGRATGRVRQRIGSDIDGVFTPDAEWGALETDEKLQITLVDTQLRFAKNAMDAEGYDLNQLVDTVRITDIARDGDYVTLTYDAVVDMVGQLRSGRVPALDQLAKRDFDAPIPLEPNAIRSEQVRPCANSDEVAEYSLYYYYEPTRQGCDIPTETVHFTIEEIFERRASYPEYDQLAHELAEGGVGFRVALVPGETENKDDERAMLVNRLQLTGTVATDGTYERFVLDRAGVKVTIDLFDPDRTTREDTFYAALREYDVVHYNGHSSYGTREFLTNEGAYSSRYQIVMMHSCRSYPYYARQVFRAKATETDPTGWALADVVATGKSSYANDAAETLEVLLTSLADGVGSLEGNATAPDWLTIVRRMNEATYMTVLYGVAGVRTNSFQP